MARSRLLFRYGVFRSRRVLHGAGSYIDAADKRWEIAPAEQQMTPASIILPGEFEKVLALEENTTPEVEEIRIKGGVVERPPVSAYQFSNAILYQGSVYGNGAERRILPYSITPARSFDHPVRSVTQGALAGSYLGLRYFGHWLTDDMALALLAEQYGKPISPTPPNLHQAHHKELHIDGYVRFLNLNWAPADNVIFESLVMFDDEAFTTHRAVRMQQIRDRAAAALDVPERRTRAYILRGIPGEGERRYANEKEVAQSLAQEGYLIVDPTVLSVDEIARTLNGVELVVAMEGSHNAHAMPFLRPGGGLLAITPPGRFNSLSKCWTDLLGLQYGILVGDPEAEGFSVNINNLRKTIDLFRL